MESDSEFVARIMRRIRDECNPVPKEADRLETLARRGAAADTKPQTGGETVRGDVTADAGSFGDFVEGCDYLPPPPEQEKL